MSKLSELVGVVEEPHLVIQEYFKTLDDWCTEMELSDPIKQSVMSSQLVLYQKGFVIVQRRLPIMRVTSITTASMSIV